LYTKTGFIFYLSEDFLMNTKKSEAPSIHPYLVLCIGALAVSTGAIFARLAEAPSLAIAAYRVGFATLFLGPPTLWAKKEELRGMTSRTLFYSVGAGFFLALHFATWIASLSYTSVASSVVLVNTIPLWTALMAPWVTGERPSKQTMVGILVSIAGGTVVGAGDFSLGPQALWGDFLALLGGLTAACYIMLGRKVRPFLSLQSYTFVCYGSAACCLWGALLLTDLSLGPYTPQTWLMFLGMALISQMVGHSAYNWALRWLSSSFVAVTLLGEPIGGTLLAYFVLGESVSLQKLLGGACILGGIYLAARGENRA
jgi:drug/metabolite transporter (DMT)-like permease